MKRFFICSVAIVAALSLGLVLLHCGGGGDDKECTGNADCPENFWCDLTVYKCKPIDCQPNCPNKCCGPDGCGGDCTPASCATGYHCNTTSCDCDPDVVTCNTNADCGTDECCINQSCVAKDCTNRTCGYDPVCNFSCGTCNAGYHCDATGNCEQDVTCNADADCPTPTTQCCRNNVCLDMNCTGMQCDADPVCGKSCGTCTPPQTCQAGQCVTSGTGALGDPCTYGDVNPTSGDCNAGLECLGVMADGAAGTCPGGSATECTQLLEEWNPDCVGNNCGASFCSQECGAGRTCPTGFAAQDVGTPATCMCVPIPTGAGQLGDPCPFYDVNASYDDCNAGLTCLGNDAAGSCPGGDPAECGLPAYDNPDCVNGTCGFSFCAGPCDAGGNCTTGFIPYDLGGTCYCVPGETGNSGPGDPCPFTGGVNGDAEACQSGLTCLGNNDAGACPGGSPTECTSIPDIHNPDCVSNVCGFSICSAKCDAGGNCDAGFVPTDVSGTCFCIPGETGTSGPGDPCPFTGGVNENADNCQAGLMCLGNDDAGACPGGDPAECTDIPASQNPDCVSNVCGFSVCAEECDAGGNCDAGFVPTDVSGTCYCIPQ